MNRSLLSIPLILALAVAVARAADEDADAPTTAQSASALPVKTTRYNRGDFPGRSRDAAGKGRRFELKPAPAPLYDGAGREIGKVTKPMMLNVGATKSMDVNGDGKAERYA